MTGAKRERVVAVIPARMGSSRFPGKPLARLQGRPMLEHVWAGVSRCESLDRVYIATCDEEIRNAAERFGAAVVMTSSAHVRATERVAEAAQETDADIVVMIQGDEPMVTPGMIDAALGPLMEDPEIGCCSLGRRIETWEEFVDPNSIKMVVSADGDALYMSRQPIPTAREGEVPDSAIKQVCIIPFRTWALRSFVSWPEALSEKMESIDMLRFLERGVRVRVVQIHDDIQAVDTPEDLALVEQLLAVSGKGADSLE